MSLVNRLSIFFLTILAVVLIGFSSTIYVVQRWSLRRQTEERLTTALKALVASIEVEPDGVEWNPLEHRLEGFANDPRWRVIDDSGAVIDESPGFPAIAVDMPADFQQVALASSQTQETWWVSSERVAIPDDAPPAKTTAAADASDGDDIPEYPAVTVVVTVAAADVHAQLNRTAATLAIVAVIVWGGALIVGRTLIRRALQPMTSMAAAATMITAGSEARLPVPNSRDEVAKLGDAFNKLLDRLDAAFERERRFTAEASHQLRTPVTALLGQLDVTLRRDRTATEYRQTLESAREQADRLRRIVESLLALARTQSPSQPPAEPVDLGAWLNGFVKIWTDRLEPAGLQLDIRQNASAAVDPELVGQVLDVLLENAAKYAPTARPIVVRLSQENGVAAIDVIDDGPGPASAEAADVFRPFHRGADAVARGIPGLGLGLALAARITDSFGGALTFDHPPEGGCRFRLALPQQ